MLFFSVVLLPSAKIQHSWSETANQSPLDLEIVLLWQAKLNVKENLWDFDCFFVFFCIYLKKMYFLSELAMVLNYLSTLTFTKWWFLSNFFIILLTSLVKKLRHQTQIKISLVLSYFSSFWTYFSVKCRKISDFLFHFWKLKKKFSVFTCILLMECSFSPNFLLAHQFWVCSAQDPVNTILVLELMEAPCSPLFWASVILDSLPQEWNRSSARFGQEREEKERWRVKMGNASPHLQLLPGRKQGLILWQNWEYQLNI